MTRTLLLSPYLGVLRDRIASTAHTHQRIIVPNRRAGQGLGQWGTQHSHPVTLTRLAQDALRAAGWSALPTGERQRWMRAILDEVSLTMLAAIRGRDSTVDCLLGLMGEFQRAHLQPDNLLRVVRSGREQDVARVYAAYRTRCLTEQRYDAAGAEHFAAGLDDLPGQPTLVHGFAYLDAAQLALLERLCAPGSVMTLPGGTGAAARTQDTVASLVAHGWCAAALHALPQTVGDQAVHGFLTGTPVPTLTAGESPDIEREVRACLRQVRDRLATGTPPEQLAILVRSEALYLDTLADVAAEYQIPLRSGLQRPLLASGFGQLLQAWLDAHTQGWTFRACEALLTNPLLDRPEFLERARTLRPTLPAGLDAWDDNLRWLALPEDTHWRAALVGTVQRLLTEFGLLARCQDDPALNRLVQVFLQRLTATAQRTDACTREDVLAHIGFTLRSVQLPALTEKSALAVLNPLGALACTFEGVWILGLSDTIFPAARRDHPLIDLHARQRWSTQGVDLPDVRSLASVEAALILAMLGTAQSTLVISRPRRSLDGQPLRPSPFWTRLQAGQAPLVLDAGSDAEQEHQHAISGQFSPRVMRGEAIERDRALRLTSPYNGRLATAVAVSSRTWTLPELQVATTCRMRWWLESSLHLSPHHQPWNDLAQAALDGALCSDDPEASAQHAARALDQNVQRFRVSGTWRPGLLWPTQRRELLGRAQQLAASAEVRTPGAVPLQSPHELTHTVSTHGYRFHIQLRLNRLENTPQGRRVTVYRRSQPIGSLDGHSALTLDMQLALTIHAAQADSGRYLAPDTGRAFGTLHHVARPTADSPITLARDVLAQLGDRLAAGDVQPLQAPLPEVCRRCPVRAVCRVSRTEVAA